MAVRIQLLRMREEMGAGDVGARRPFWIHQFVDDFTCVGLGMLRVLRMLLNFWKICRGLRLPVGYAKTETGTLMTNLGKDFYLSRRRAKSTEEKEELESVTGMFGFGVTTKTNMKPLMSRSYKAKSSSLWRKGPYTLLTQPFRNDLIIVGKELVRNEGVRFADLEKIWLNPSDLSRYGWTDSCRHKYRWDGVAWEDTAWPPGRHGSTDSVKKNGRSGSM